MPLPEGDSPAEIQRSAAVQLFAQRARKHRSDLMFSDRDWAHIAAICRELGGVPLAIELAAGLVNVLSCEEILTEIREDLSVLVTSSRDAPDRHRSLRAVFDYSWELLNEDERAAWMRLSVFPAGFSRAAATEVARASLPALAALADKSLLHRTPAGRYAIHEMLRRHGGEKLTERPEQQQNTEAGFVRYFAEFAAQRGQQGRGVGSNKLLAEMAEEVENLRLGFRWAVERGEPLPIEQFTEGLFQFYDSYGWYQEGEETFRWAAERTSDERLLGLLLGRQGHFSSKLGKQEQAKALHRRSIAMLRRSGVPDQAALSLYGLGTIAYQEGDYTSAERLLRRCGQLYRDTGSAFGLALCLNDLGNVALMQGRDADAERRFRKSLALRTEIDDQAGRARCLTNLGIIADHRHDLEEARRCFEQSLAAARDAADRKSVATALNNLGVLARRLGEESTPQLLTEARQFLQEALEVYEEIGSRGGATLTLYNLGDVACLREEYEASEAYYVEAARRAQAIHATSLLTTIVLGAAKLLINTGSRERAVELLFPVLDHPATIDEDRQITRELLTELASLLEPAVFRAAQQTGKSLTLEEVAEAISAGQLRNQPRHPASLPTPEQNDQTGMLEVEASIQQGSTAERAAWIGRTSGGSVEPWE